MIIIPGESEVPQKILVKILPVDYCVYLSSKIPEGYDPSVPLTSFYDHL